MIHMFDIRWLLNSWSVIKSISDAPCPHIPLTDVFRQNVDSSWFCDNILKCLFTICLCSLYRQHLFGQNTKCFFSIFYTKVIFAQIFIKVASCFMALYLVNYYYWISWRPEHLSSGKKQQQKKEVITKMLHYDVKILEKMTWHRLTKHLNCTVAHPSCCKTFSSEAFFCPFHVNRSFACSGVTNAFLISHGNLLCSMKNTLAVFTIDLTM